MNIHAEGESCRHQDEGVFAMTLLPGGGADVRGVRRATRLL